MIRRGLFSWLAIAPVVVAVPAARTAAELKQLMEMRECSAMEVVLLNYCDRLKKERDAFQALLDKSREAELDEMWERGIANGTYIPTEDGGVIINFSEPSDG